MCIGYVNYQRYRQIMVHLITSVYCTIENSKWSYSNFVRFMYYLLLSDNGTCSNKIDALEKKLQELTLNYTNVINQLPQTGNSIRITIHQRARQIQLTWAIIFDNWEHSITSKNFIQTANKESLPSLYL